MGASGKYIRRALLALPWVVSIPFAIYALADSFLEGLHFTSGLHVFGWFLHWAIGGAVVLGVASIALIGLQIAPKSQELRKGIGKELATLALSVVVPILMLGFVPDAFFWGRDRAYANLDTHRLMTSCAEIARLRATASQPDTSDFVAIQRGNPEFQNLPEYVRELRPPFVYIRGQAIMLQMDGGGIMYCEGLLVVPSMPTDRFAQLCQSHNLRLLDADCRVAMYRVDDYRRMLFDFVRADAVSNIPQTGPCD